MRAPQFIFAGGSLLRDADLLDQLETLVREGVAGVLAFKDRTRTPRR